MDQSEEWDPPQSWPRAESGIMNRASGATVQREEKRRNKAQDEAGKA